MTTFFINVGMLLLGLCLATFAFTSFGETQKPLMGLKMPAIEAGAR